MLSFIKILAFLFEIGTVTQLEIKGGDADFYITHLKWVNNNTLEIKWLLDETLVSECREFVFTLFTPSNEDEEETDDSQIQLASEYHYNITRRYSKFTRHALIDNISDDFEKVSGTVIFNTIQPRFNEIDIPSRSQKLFRALISRNKDLYGCFDDKCHNIKHMYSTKTDIRGIAFGRLQSEIIVLTAEEIIFFDMVFSNSTIKHLNIPENVIAFKYDGLNKVMNIGTAKKVYQASMSKSRPTVEITMENILSLIDLTVDPINGYLYLLINETNSFFCTKIPTVISKNATLSSVEIGRIKVKQSSSLIFDVALNIIETLTNDSIVTYSLPEMIATAHQLHPPLRFNLSFKFDKQSHGYMAWTPNNLHHLEADTSDKSKYGITKISSQFSLYVNVLSAVIGDPIPPLSMVVSDGFFGSNFLMMTWIQPARNWSSPTRWNQWIYRIEISKNQTVIYQVSISNNNNQFRFQNLTSNTPYSVAIKIGSFSQSIHGRSLISDPGPAVDLFIYAKNVINMITYSVETFKVISQRSVLKEALEFKNIFAFNDRTYVLLRNGLVLKAPRYNDIEDKSKWMTFGDVNAKKIAINFKFGNIYFIANKDNKVYRIRPTPNSTYQIDPILNIPVIDIAVFPNNDILVYTNTSGQYFCNMNGLPLVDNSTNGTVSYYYTDNYTMIAIGQNKRLISYSSNDSRWRIVTMGLIQFSYDVVTLTAFYGNASLKVIDGIHEVEDVFELEKEHFTERIMELIQVKSMKISRSTRDELELSWKPLSQDGDIVYYVTTDNGTHLSTKTSKNSSVSLTSEYLCSQKITAHIRPCNDGTCGNSVQKSFVIPCTAASPEIKTIFYINKVFGNVRETRFEFYGGFDLHSNTDMVDNHFKCFMKIYFNRVNATKMITSMDVDCRDRSRCQVLLVDDVDRFEWDRICMTIGVMGQSASRCETLTFWKNVPREVYFPIKQDFIGTRIKEEIVKIFIANKGHSINILMSCGGNRTVLTTEAYITDIGIDWTRNNLLWIEAVESWYVLFGVDLATNKVNLNEDKVVWFKIRTEILKWSIDSIDRKIFVEFKDLNMTLRRRQFNLDAGPGWSSELMSQCYELISRNGSVTCHPANSLTNKRDFKVIYVKSQKSLVLMMTNVSLCKIIDIDDHYYQYNYLYNCRQIVSSNIAHPQYPIISNNTGDGPFIAIDSDGKSYSTALDNNRQCSLYSEEVNTTKIRVVCFRTAAVVIVQSSVTSWNYNVTVAYVKDGMSTSINVDLLDQRLLTGEDHSINIGNMSPASDYHFSVQLTSNLSNSSLVSTNCTCRTQDDIPSRPESIQIYPINDTYFKVRWKDGRNNGRNISSYNIRINKQSLFVTSTREFFLRKKRNERAILYIQSINSIGISNAAETRIDIVEIRKVAVKSQSLSDFSFASSPLFLTLCMIILCIGVLMIIIVFRKRRQKTTKSTENSRRMLKYQPMELATMGLPVNYDINCLYSADHLPLTEFDKIPHIPQSSLTIGHLIGNGAFGMVFKGTMKIESDLDKIVIESVALKMRHGKSLSEDDFKREAVLLFKYFCPYIIRIYGVSFDSPERQLIILEYMEKGNLRQYLHHHRPDSMTAKRTEIERGREKTQKHVTLCFRDFFEIASDVLEAMKFLEQKKFIHRDLAARNCLVSHKHKKGRITKLGDFGLARDIYSDEYYRKVSETKMPIRWMSPETMKDGVFSGKSDIWSYGVLLWEIFTLGMDPYTGESNADVVKDVIAGKHMEKPEECPYELYEVMLQCWKYYPEQRPSFTEIDLMFHRLDEMRDNEEMSSSNRLIIRSYVSTDSSNLDCDDGNNSEHLTEKTFLSVSEKYFDIATKPTNPNPTNIQSEYDNLGYDVPLIRSRMVSTTTEETNVADDNECNPIAI